MHASIDVAYLTSGIHDPDLDGSLQALNRSGLTCEAVNWSCRDTDWSRYRSAVVRSTWDYIEDREAFLGALRTISSTCLLLNPLDVIEWNTDKGYLADLARAGCPTVPTLWVDPEVCSSASALSRSIPSDWEDLVVKPAVGAGGTGAMRTRDREKACAYAMSSGRMLVQPYLDAVDSEGEKSFVFLGGEFSHAVTRGPYLPEEIHRDTLLPPGSEESAWTVESFEPDAEYLALAHAALAAVPAASPLPYARVDVIRDQRGAPRVAEVEVVEPFLFLGYSDSASARFAGALREAIVSAA
ncbi:ATP-grasp domain-containing protein [Streptomyces indicus]|uniref:ATP-grasp domain-containing protein n=1 Tax=Streptomyces indicus TaxID=417292 RepID=A0A1G9DUQ0_9ACTN|nr:hypothetical protein [Streptomyces indicus]SDK67587.1 hypothetical protein SAMN05421806_11072 [Streptomyces indicus]